MKNIHYIFVFTLLLLGLVACEDFLDINKSIDSPTTVTVDQALPAIVFYAAQEVYDHAEYGVYLSQALTTASKSQTGSYAYSQGWEFLSMNRHPQWRRHYYDVGANINELVKAANQANSNNFKLIARTIMLQSTMMTTDVFGDMPRSNAYTATSPTYDTQEEVYQWLFEEADELLALYRDDEWANNPNDIPISEKMDRIYKGDMKKWELYTKALRARLWLRKLPNWENNPTVCDRIISMVDEVLNDPNWEEPRYNYPGGTNEQNCPWGPAAPIINAWESRGNRLASSMPSKFFAYALLGTYENRTQRSGHALDPRAVKLMTPRLKSGAAGSDLLRWLDNNIGMDISMKVTDYPDLYGSGENPFTQNDGYVALILDEELMFIKAEAEYWKGDKLSAFNTTKKAVLTNMVRLGVTESVETDGEDLRGFNKDIYKRFFEIKLQEDDFNIGDLMQQKYVAMYLQPEQWTDLRRYNYSSKSNGITYDNVPVYTVRRVFSGRIAGNTVPTIENSTAEFSLRRPFNLYVPYWDQPDSYGVNAELSPNAWIMRLNYDPETEDKYNRGELERLGAFKNPEWLKKRMIWSYNHSNKAQASDNTEWK